MKNFILVISAVLATNAALSAAQAQQGSAAPPSAQVTPDTVANDSAANLPPLELNFQALAQSTTPQEAMGPAQAIERTWQAEGGATAQLLLARAAQAHEKAETGMALTLIGATLDVAPDYAEAYHRRAALHAENGDIMRAMIDLRSTLQHQPRHYIAWSALGRFLDEAGDRKNAYRALQRAKALHPFLPGLDETLPRLRVEAYGRDT